MARDNALLTGSRRSSTSPVRLRAGALTGLLDGADLRKLRIGGVEIAQRIEVTIRDASWGTLPAQVSGVEVGQSDESFVVTFDARHEQGEVALRWRGRIEGSSDGTLVFSMDGEAERDFDYCRIGICVLHPLSVVGRPARTSGVDAPSDRRLSREVVPQLFIDGVVHPAVPPFTHLEIEASEDMTVTFSFEGDEFEIEDQRNWTDGSIKTYCTPLSRGFPHSAHEGETFQQKVSIDAGPAPVGSDERHDRPVRLELGTAIREGLPAIGFEARPSEDRIGEHQLRLLKELGPSHIRVELNLGNDDLPGVVAGARAIADRLATQLELAVFGHENESYLQALSEQVDGLPVSRVLVSARTPGVTEGEDVARVRSILAPVLHPDVQWIAGTDGHFADFNRIRPDLGTADGVTFSITPQFHAFDDLSLVENLAGQAPTVETAAMVTERSVHVSPITLRPRSAPWSLPGPLPTHVDPRQVSFFAAAWTLASIKHLTEAGAESLTYYELVGWGGLMEWPEGSPIADFPSEPGMIFPTYHVFSALSGWNNATVMSLVSEDSELVAGLALRSDAGLRLLLANLTDDPCPVRLDIGDLVLDSSTVRILEASSYETAEPAGSWATGDWGGPEDGLTLPPYGIVRIDVDVRSSSNS